MRRSDGRHHFKRAGLTVAPGVFARVVQVKTVVGMLDHRQPQAALFKSRNQRVSQRGFTSAGIARKTDQIHPTIQFTITLIAIRRRVI